MARNRAWARWPFAAEREDTQVEQAVIDLRRYGVSTNKKDLIRAALRVALRDLPTLADEVRSEPTTHPPA
jgi:hypothetical protein